MVSTQEVLKSVLLYYNYILYFYQQDHNSLYNENVITEQAKDLYYTVQYTHVHV